MIRKAKIVATIGPSSQDQKTIEKLLEAGMDVARLNFSHGTQSEHADKMERIRATAQKAGRSIAILQDLQGPKLRVGRVSQEGILLKSGQTVVLSSLPPSSNMHASMPFIPMDIPDFEKSMSRGSRILMDDGKLELKVIKVEDDIVEATVINGGILFSRKGVNLPGADLVFPSLTEKDLADLKFGLDQGVDYIALSFVVASRDIVFLREAIHKINPQKDSIPIIAKLERPEAIQNLHELLHVSDGVMVARGDLGVELSPSVVPTMQKTIIREANRHAKIVITATQMLESMIQNPRPTRAEASDVANAVFDGTDAVMLSGESASGKYPVESVVMMDEIVRDAEAHIDEWGHKCQLPVDPSRDDAISITRAVRELALDVEVGAIAVFTLSGQTALLMSKTRPPVPILAFTPNESTYQKMNLYWGTKAFLVPVSKSVEEMISVLERTILREKILNNGQQIAVISGMPVNAMKKANFALLHTIGEA